MPIDNDYFKKKQQGGGGSSSNNGGGGDYQPPFEPPEFLKNLGKKRKRLPLN